MRKLDDEFGRSRTLRKWENPGDKIIKEMQ